MKTVLYYSPLCTSVYDTHLFAKSLKKVKVMLEIKNGIVKSKSQSDLMNGVVTLGVKKEYGKYVSFEVYNM